MNQIEEEIRVLQNSIEWHQYMGLSYKHLEDRQRVLLSKLGVEGHV